MHYHDFLPAGRTVRQSKEHYQIFKSYPHRMNTGEQLPKPPMSLMTSMIMDLTSFYPDDLLFVSGGH